jgi:hypothetical protein
LFAPDRVKNPGSVAAFGNAQRRFELQKIELEEHKAKMGNKTQKAKYKWNNPFGTSLPIPPPATVR